MKSICLSILFLLLPAFAAHAQDHHGHHHQRNEIGLSAGALYAIDHSEWGVGVHLHYFRTLADHSRWAVGGFAEQAWIGDSHTSLGAGVKFEPVRRLYLGAFPGVTFAKHEEEHDGHTHDESGGTRFSLHFEVGYDLFHWEQFHLGPVFDYSWAKRDSHIMIGIHAAFCF